MCATSVGLRLATASIRSRAQSTPGSRSRSAATASRTRLSRDTLSSKVGSRSQRADLGNRGRSFSGTARPRATASSISPPLCSRMLRPMPLMARSSSMAVGDLRERSSNTSLVTTRKLLRSSPFATPSRHDTNSLRRASSRRVRSRAPFMRRKAAPASSVSHRVPSSRANSSSAQCHRPFFSSASRRRWRSSSRCSVSCAA